MNKELQEAAEHGDVDKMRQALEAGANINDKDKYGQTALMNSARFGHTKCVKLLVERGADLNATAKYNLSALMLAVISGHFDAVRILAEAGAEKSIRGCGVVGFHGKTALELAVAFGQIQIVNLLNRIN